MSGPPLCFYAFDQGNAFAARAAHATLVGLIAVPFFSVAYVYTGRYRNWVVSLLAGWLAFCAGVMVLMWLDPGVAAAWVLLAASCALGYMALPAHAVFAEPSAHSAWDLPMRMLAAAGLVFVLTSVADRLGPALTGLFPPFPAATGFSTSFSSANAVQNARSTKLKPRKEQKMPDGDFRFQYIARTLNYKCD